MKCLKKILINNSAVFAAALFTSLSGFAQNKTDLSQNVNSIKLSSGLQIWKNKNLKNSYGDMITFKANYQRELKKDLELETSFNFFIPKRENTEIGEYNLTNFAINLGLNKHVLVSEDKKIGMYLNGGLKYVMMKEKAKIEYHLNPLIPTEKIEKSQGVGYFLGAGLERYLTPEAVLFFEANINETPKERHKENLTPSGNELTIGIRLF